MLAAGEGASNATYAALVSGAGIAGPTLAYWLARYGFDVMLVERAPGVRTGGYIIDFWGLGYDVADRMQLVLQLESVGYRVQELRFVTVCFCPPIAKCAVA